MLTGDLKSPRWIVAKGILFLVCVVLAAIGLLERSPEWTTLALVLILAWASARFYYFLFYVLHTYVDPRLKYAGIGALLRALLARRDS